MLLCSKHCAGLSLMHGSGVFLYCNNSFATWLLSVPRCVCVAHYH